MKGVVFTEFIALVEETYGLEKLEGLMSACALHSQGAYTAVGSYDHQELMSMVSKLSDTENITPKKVLVMFGRYIHHTFLEQYSAFFKDQDTFSFLKSIDSHIHVEVIKLYPDAELPKFEYNQEDSNTLVLHYKSTRPFADLAEGLILQTIEHFGESISLQQCGEGTDFDRVFTLIKARKPDG